MADWTPALSEDGKPHYQAIADAIAADIETGRLKAGDRLPPQRRLAAALGIDFTTVSRAYTEAQSRGLVQSHVGRGTFIAPKSEAALADPERRLAEDLSMNMPPEPDDPELLARMRSGLEAVSANLVDLLRYQAPTGTERDRLAAARWLSACGISAPLDRIAVTPGAHATLSAIMSTLTTRGDIVLCEALTYPGFRNIAARFGVTLVGVEMDGSGVTPEALQEAISRNQPKALYLNPTLHNPTTRTLPPPRRAALAEILQAHQLPLIEDDAYGFIPARPPQAIAARIPDLTWYIGGVSKSIGAGLRLAFSVAPSARDAHRLTQAIRAFSVMPSPLSMALVTQWIEDGTADRLRHAIRSESAARQSIARKALEGQHFESDETAFNIWLTLPEGVGRADVVARMAGRPLGLMPADAFSAAGSPPERLRVSLGGSISRDDLRDNLFHLGNALLPNDFLG